MLFTTLRAMAEMGRTVIFISHKLHEVKAVADRVTVLRGGRTIATVSTEDATPRSLAALMVGRELAESRGATRSSAQAAETILETRRPLRRRRSRRGGAQGRLARRRAPARSSRSRASPGTASASSPRRSRAFGRRRPGASTIAGRALRAGDPRAAIAAGVAYVPEDRLGTGLAPSLSIASNLALKSYRGGRRRPAGPLLRLRAIRERAVELIRRYRIAAPGPDAQARQLSGGNLQKVVLAREFTARAAPDRRRRADARARRRRDRDRARVPPRGGRRRRRRCC